MDFDKIISIPETTPIVTFSLFRYKSDKQFWALNMMRKAIPALKETSGLYFYKLLGSGKNYGLQPNFSTYAMICCWTNEYSCSHFFKNSPLWRTYCENSEEQWTIKLLHQQSHGKWDGKNPFEHDYICTESDLPIIVLTRATLNLSTLFSFWKRVPQISRDLAQNDGVLFSLGIGEIPIVRQATLSIWKDTLAMKQFAYTKSHKEAVTMTKKNGWFKEELFARFIPIASKGTWHGNDVLKSYLRKKIITSEVLV